MKLLLENWRKYLIQEQNAPWVEDLKKDKWAVENEEKFKPVGSGAFRKVYSPIGHEDFIVKVIRNPKDVYMNKKDIELSVKYPDIIPKTFEHGPCITQQGQEQCGYDWFVMEAVTVLKRHGPGAAELFTEMLKVNFPEIVRLASTDAEVQAAIEGIHVTGGVPFIMWLLVRRSINYGKRNYGGYTSAEREKTEDPRELPQPWSQGELPDKSDQDVWRHSDLNPKPVYKKIFDVGMHNDIYRQLFKAASIDEVDIGDIVAGNIGIDRESNFKIIDTSVFL